MSGLDTVNEFMRTENEKKNIMIIFSLLLFPLVFHHSFPLFSSFSCSWALFHYESPRYTNKVLHHVPMILIIIWYSHGHKWPMGAEKFECSYYLYYSNGQARIQIKGLNFNPKAGV